MLHILYIIKVDNILIYTHVCMLSSFSLVWLFATPWTVGPLAPLSMEFSKQEYWQGLPCPPQWDLWDSGIKPTTLTSPALAAGFFTLVPPGKPIYVHIYIQIFFRDLVIKHLLEHYWCYDCFYWFLIEGSDRAQRSFIYFQMHM